MTEMKVKQKGETLIKVGYRIPEALNKALAEKAKADRRSVNDQVIFLLEKALKEEL